MKFICNSYSNMHLLLYDLISIRPIVYWRETRFGPNCVESESWKGILNVTEECELGSAKSFNDIATLHWKLPGGLRVGIVTRNWNSSLGI